MAKKILAIMIALMMVLALAACGGSETSSDEAAEETTEAAETESDGIEQEVFQPKDNILIVRFTNNTGGDISLSVETTYNDEEYETSSWHEQKYLPAGEVFIIADEADGAILDYDVNYSIEEASPSVKAYYEQTPYTIEGNSLGGIDFTLQDNTEDGYNDELWIFYEDSAGSILGYDYTSYGGSEDFYHTFEAPGYEYDKYEIIRDKLD